MKADREDTSLPLITAVLATGANEMSAGNMQEFLHKIRTLGEEQSPQTGIHLEIGTMAGGKSWKLLMQISHAATPLALSATADFISARDPLVPDFPAVRVHTWGEVCGEATKLGQGLNSSLHLDEAHLLGEPTTAEVQTLLGLATTKPIFIGFLAFNWNLLPLPPLLAFAATARGVNFFSNLCGICGNSGITQFLRATPQRILGREDLVGKNKCIVGCSSCAAVYNQTVRPVVNFLTPTTAPAVAIYCDDLVFADDIFKKDLTNTLV
jgi:hypothetical protein